ncbi:DUF4153 domain-containing protein [Mucilaginibacter galii]|uniref:DUF4153 domain-containing protein n=1 Tax=Mucilaginibacter galii TaxID=2005073 RepID=A0A917J9W9_9SPHI|nr:DUF4153 domain-containing protein [Mucilaginibacter galii]GGI51698.1 hypothetical protein GCM10011425_29100 [Mucilaginibacter galii]
MKQLPSATFLYRQITDTIKRFPFEFAFTVVGTLAAVGLSNMYLDGYISNNWNRRILMMSAIGLPLSFATTLFVQSKAFSLSKKLLLKSFAALIAISLLFALRPTTHPQDTVHFVLIFLASHLLVSFAGFTGANNTIAFWEFNRALLSRLLLGILYSLALALGLTAAFSAVNSLFGFELDWSNLYKIWIVTFGLFNTMFVLAGFSNYTQLVQAEFVYPKGLKFFIQYVLVPLAIIYLVILLAYEAKILVEWQLPKGSVSALILGYAGVGLLSLLLIYPIRKQEDNGWIKVYSKYFYLFLLPLTILLVLAVTTRINSYGITQYRYFIIALAIWLTFLIVYFLIYKKANIKVIPISLFVVIMLVVYGPLSATAISLRSQKSVLLDLFIKAKSVRHNKLQPINENKVKPFVAVRMASTLVYISKHYDFDAMQSLLNVNLKHINDSLRKDYNMNSNYDMADNDSFNWTRSAWLQSYLRLGGYEYRQNYTQDELEDSILANYYINAKEGISLIKGYDYMMVKDPYTDSLKNDTVAGYVVKQHDDFDQNYMILNIGTTQFKFSAKDLATQLAKQTEIMKAYEDTNTPQGLDKKYAVPQKMLRLTQQKANFEVTVQFQEMSFDYSQKEGVRIGSVKAYYFIKFR